VCVCVYIHCVDTRNASTHTYTVLHVMSTHQMCIHLMCTHYVYVYVFSIFRQLAHTADSHDVCRHTCIHIHTRNVTQKSPMYHQKRPIDTQKSPVYNQKRPMDMMCVYTHVYTYIHVMRTHQMCIHMCRHTS